MGRHRDLLLAWLERCPEEPDFMRLFFPAHGVTLDGHPVAGCYFHALDLFRSLADTSETAATAYGPTRKALSEYLVELGDERRARWVFDHYELPPR